MCTFPEYANCIIPLGKKIMAMRRLKKKAEPMTQSHRISERILNGHKKEDLNHPTIPIKIKKKRTIITYSTWNIISAKHTQSRIYHEQKLLQISWC